MVLPTGSALLVLAEQVLEFQGEDSSCNGRGWRQAPRGAVGDGARTRCWKCGLGKSTPTEFEQNHPPPNSTTSSGCSAWGDPAVVVPRRVRPSFFP
jgi:hypothetical protein